MEGPLVLPDDLTFVPVAELPPQLREKIQAEDGDYAVTRPLSRTPSKIVDAQMYALLREFEKPKTIVEAVFHYSKAIHAKPSQVLDDAFPLLQSFVSAKLLVDPESGEGKKIEPTLVAGDRIAGVEIEKCLQVLADTELYRVKTESGSAALKLTRSGTHSLAKMFAHEAGILRHLDGQNTPRLLSAGKLDDEREYLLLEWCDGVDAATAAQRFREDDDRKGLLGLCESILDAYAHLHAQGVIHSDVHPRNLLVAEDGSVKIIDFGVARRSRQAAPRAGIPMFYDPEYAQALLKQSAPPPSSFASDQYSLAAMLYSLLRGANYLNFSPVRDEMLRQIAEDEPLAMDSDPTEPVLRTALNKQPAGRFSDVAELARAFRDATKTQPPSVAQRDFLETFLQSVLERVAEPRRNLETPKLVAPTASITYGAAGIASALYRIAQVRGDAKLLGLADLWISEAASQIPLNGAFYSDSLKITEDTVGKISPYHTASGIHAMRALIANAMGDGMSLNDGVNDFIAASEAPCDNPDLTLGQSSTLLALALMIDAISATGPESVDGLLTYGDGLLQRIWEGLPRQEVTYLGMAHGWAGLCYAALRWAKLSGSPLPQAVPEKLLYLAELGQTTTRGLRWPWRADHPNECIPGWCNGTAGYVFLWTLAHEVLGEDAYLRLAERAGNELFGSKENGQSLCCGLAGQAYSLLNLHRHTGDAKWAQRAEVLAVHAAKQAMAVAARGDESLPLSLYKGEVGVAALIADLARPEASSMPFFEEEGWSGSARRVKSTNGAQ